MHITNGIIIYFLSILMCVVPAGSHGNGFVSLQLRAGVPEARGTLSATASPGETCVVAVVYFKIIYLVMFDIFTFNEFVMI